MLTNQDKPIYILSLEAGDIYSHMYRGGTIRYNYCGMIPFSLEAIKLRQEGLKVKYIESRDKEISNDIINVKFKQKVKSAVDLKKVLSNKQEKFKNNLEYYNKIDQFVKYIEQDEKDVKWNEVNANDLRKKFYTEGFSIKHKTSTGEMKETEYVVYKRSSSKSRTGQCLFIKKSLYSRMIKWSRLGLPFKNNMEIDLAGLLAYESLVGSSLESTLNINPENILIVKDLKSKFEIIGNVVRKGKDGFLDSFTEKTNVSNSLFDGESLLESKYFEDGVAMKLLRNHMFKSAAFNCNIQAYLKDNCPKGTEYNEWTLKDMFGNDIYAKDVDLICTPSSLKALKFSSVVGGDKSMWVHWKKKVNEDGNTFGVCKHDKASKFGEDENGNVLQQTSYQMINCLPLSRADIKSLVETEKNYAERLKNDDDFFIEKVYEKSALVNSNEMLTSLFNHNSKLINTKLYRNYRKDFIWNHVSNSKKGKIKLPGDYCVMIGNPMEFLKHAIGNLDVDNVMEDSLKGNEVYTKLFEFNKEYVGFRNPNTSPANVLIVKNKKISDIERYFNLTENIVCVNAINFPIQDILSGCDYDSDTVLLFNDPKMLELGKKCFGHYNVCINDVKGQQKTYKLNKYDMCEIDNQLSTSQRNIGKVVNLGQFCMSVYWDLINKGYINSDIDQLLKKVDVMTILSGISIDMAKKFYEIDISKEIENVSKNNLLKERVKKPIFWKYVSQNKSIGKKIEPYDCPMDFLIEELEGFKQADRKVNIDFEKLLIKKNEKKANRKQLDKIFCKLEEVDNAVKSLNASSKELDEKSIEIEDVLKECADRIKKFKIKEDTMYSLLKNTYEEYPKLLLRLLKILYDTHQDVFINAFKKGKN